MLQKQENKQFQDLSFKAQFGIEQQEKRFELETIALKRNYDNDLDALNRQQKQLVEKAEQQQELDLKFASKKIRLEQERELKQFRESMKNELKLLKQEVDLLPKDKRKDVFRVRKEKLDIDHSERERIFLESLNDSHDSSIKRLSESHRDKLALLERQFLQQKQQLQRAREAAIWELEERHMHEKHQLSKRQLKDSFFLQRHQMLVRHEKVRLFCLSLQTLVLYLIHLIQFIPIEGIRTSQTNEYLTRRRTLEKTGNRKTTFAETNSF
jgi:hypothetical protein